MCPHPYFLRSAIGAVLLASALSWAASTPAVSAVSPVTDFVVRYREAAQTQTARQGSAAERVNELRSRSGVELTHVRSLSERADIVRRAGGGLSRAEAWQIAAKLATDPQVADVKPVDPDFDLQRPVYPTR